ncbi:hypothetical protein EVAR_52941_1 [Eumeta japonica]|uniref:Uncharacterized protein n=1 Tax=Eumeta variegata TaxID=151549 RepID=A0A4C1XS44_EUMVA|nr:hypothetical protein EVAR_52941_1 [Eumeta japonica]
MTGAVPAGTPHAGRHDSPRSGRVSSQHAAPTDGQNVIMYIDEFRRSMGLQLSRRLVGKNILKICMPGASHEIYWKLEIVNTNIQSNSIVIILIGRR